MNTEREGPSIEQLTHRLASTPPEFLDLAKAAWDEKTRLHTGLAALVNDHARRAGHCLSDGELRSFERRGSNDATRARHFQLSAAVCWMLADETLTDRALPREGFVQLFRETLFMLANQGSVSVYLTEPDRREELARIVLQDLGLRPAGESPEQALDRLSALSVTERRRLQERARATEERARKIREALAAKAAAEAADKYTRE